ncbi:hypothetical protein niasHT_019096 [Heterodera trifolii]|uniref:Uncharacterized protein n=1 Tax=Heterodera trifolii TaxID=157864 RepID=A0ABD2LB07_9BILA
MTGHQDNAHVNRITHDLGLSSESIATRLLNRQIGHGSQHQAQQMVESSEEEGADQTDTLSAFGDDEILMTELLDEVPPFNLINQEFWAATRAVDVRVVDEHGNLIYTPPPAAHVPQLLEQFIQDVNSAIGQASTGLMEARVVAAWAHYQLIVDTIHLKIMDRHGALGGNIRAVDMRIVDEHGNFIYTPPPSTHVPELLDQFIHDVNSAIGQVSTGLMEARVVAACAHYQLVIEIRTLPLIGFFA